MSALGEKRKGSPRVLLPRSVWSNKVKIADDLGVAVAELEYVQAIRHDASWVVQLRGSEMNRAFFGSALATLLFAGQAPAQPYPSRPVTFIVPYGAGGPVDTLARILSEPMRRSLGQQWTRLPTQRYASG